jgi:hypothetical protein
MRKESKIPESAWEQYIGGRWFIVGFILTGQQCELTVFAEGDNPQEAWIDFRQRYGMTGNRR